MNDILIGLHGVEMRGSGGAGGGGGPDCGLGMSSPTDVKLGTQ